MRRSKSCLFFFFNDTATTEIYTLSLHDALPICIRQPERIRGPECPVLDRGSRDVIWRAGEQWCPLVDCFIVDRKSTRLNSSHQIISYAVFCLKKKRSLPLALGVLRSAQAVAHKP